MLRTKLTTLASICALAFAVALAAPRAGSAVSICNEAGQQLWVYRTGATNTTDSNQALAFATGECQEHWATVAFSVLSVVDPTFSVSVFHNSCPPGPYFFQCKVCVVAIPHVLPPPIRLTLLEAAEVGLSEVPGHVVSVELVEEGEEHRYVVDIQTSSGWKQVEVDATTGEVRQPSLEPAVICAER